MNKLEQISSHRKQGHEQGKGKESRLVALYSGTIYGYAYTLLFLVAPAPRNRFAMVSNHGILLFCSAGTIGQWQRKYGEEAAGRCQALCHYSSSGSKVLNNKVR